jgi:hypothetical protein
LVLRSWQEVVGVFVHLRATDIQDKPKYSTFMLSLHRVPTNAWKGDADQLNLLFLLMKPI